MESEHLYEKDTSKETQTESTSAPILSKSGQARMSMPLPSESTSTASAINPETVEVSHANKEASPGRDGGSNQTIPSAVNEDPTAAGRARIKAILSQESGNSVTTPTPATTDQTVLMPVSPPSIGNFVPVRHANSEIFPTPAPLFKTDYSTVDLGGAANQINEENADINKSNRELREAQAESARIESETGLSIDEYRRQAAFRLAHPAMFDSSNPQEIPAISMPISPHLPGEHQMPKSDVLALSGEPSAQMKDYANSQDHNRVRASQFSAETQAALAEQGLDDYQMVLDDNTGKSAEYLAQTVIAGQGLPDGSGGYTQFRQVISGQYNETGNGIDLVGITLDGKPYPIEVKKRANPERDTIGADTVKNLNDETRQLLDNIELERRNNPVLVKNMAIRDSREPDNEMSPDQMSDLWLRDRWISLVKSDIEGLKSAGINPKYLDLGALVQKPYSDEWKDILGAKHTVIISINKDDVSNSLLRQATLKKGFDVSVIDLSGG